MKKIYSGVSVILIAVVSLLLVQATKAQTPTTIAVGPFVQTVALNGTGTFTLSAVDAQDLGSFGFTFHFDPTIIQVTPANVTVSTQYMSSTGRTVTPLVDTSAIASGTVTIGAYSTGNQAGPSGGTGVLATIQFTAVGTGTTTITIDSNTLEVTDTATPPNLQATTIQTGSITVGQVSPSATPQATASPGATPQPSATPGSSDVTLMIKANFEGVDVDSARLPTDVKVMLRKDNQTDPATLQTSQFVFANGYTTSDALAIYQNANPIVYQSSLINVPTGVYDVYLKGQSHLSKIFSNVNITAGQTNTIDLTNDAVAGGRLLGGDATGDDWVYIDDYTIFSNEFSAQASTQNADFNRDGRVDILDFSYIKAHFDLHGDLP